MRFVFSFILFFALARADVLQIRDFTTDIYSKAGANITKKISMDIELIGRDMDENEPYALDALNIIIGSFYVEDLLTSKGKEKFKDAYKKYALKKHNIDLEAVLILSMKVVEDLSLERVIAAIKERNLCYTPSGPEKKGDNEIIISPNNANQKPIDLNSILEYGKDFGQ